MIAKHTGNEGPHTWNTRDAAPSTARPSQDDSLQSFNTERVRNADCNCGSQITTRSDTSELCAESNRIRTRKPAETLEGQAQNEARLSKQRTFLDLGRIALLFALLGILALEPLRLPLLALLQLQLLLFLVLLLSRLRRLLCNTLNIRARNKAKRTVKLNLEEGEARKPIEQRKQQGIIQLRTCARFFAASSMRICDLRQRKRCIRAL